MFGAASQVFIFGRGSVKPADKRYSRVRNDYALHFDTASEVELCGASRLTGAAASNRRLTPACTATLPPLPQCSAADDIDISKMQARMEFVPIGQLAAYVDKKVCIAFWLFCSAHLAIKAGEQARLPCFSNGASRLLPLHTACQVLVDLTGVVTEVKPLGSVKRKTDQVELSRRDITLVDQRCAELAWSAFPA